MISPLDRTIWYFIKDDPLDTSMGFGSSYSKDSDILHKTINCQDDFIGFSGTYLSNLSAGQHLPFDKSLNHDYIKILESDWSSAGLISAVIGQVHTSCACNWTVVRVMPE